MRVITLCWCVLFLCNLGDSIKNNALFLMREFLNTTKLSSVNMFICSNKDVLGASKFLSAHGIKFTINLLDNSPELYKLLSTYTCGVAVVVELRCAESHHIIKQASEQKLLSSLHHWLLLGDVNSTIDENINIPLNSHVVLATELKDDSSADIVLRDVYKLSTSWSLTYTPARVWLPGQTFPPSPSRDDFQGLVLRAAIVVMEDSWESHDDLRYKHLNTWSKLTYGPMKNVAKMLNFSMTETETESWGFLNPDGSFSGMVGLLQRNECDIGAVQCAITPGRRVAVEFAAEMVPFRPRFIFRQPSLSSVTNIYILPFSVAVWSTYALTTIVLTVFLFATQRLERRAKKCQATVPPENWSGALLTSLGIICQQGCPTTPGNVSSRIIFLFLFLLSTFFFTSYSAIIVSLLQTPSSTINTLNALLRSPLKIVVNDINYNFNYDNYVNESASSLVKELFHERILSHPKQDVYLTMEHGVELIRTGMFAFHVDMGAYKIIGDTWHDSEKCNLKEVFMFPAYKGAIPVQKGSPYRDHISRRLRWLREVGMVNREWKRWVTEKPTCDTHYSGFISVGIEDFYPALLVLTYGIPCSLVMIILELIHVNLTRKVPDKVAGKPLIWTKLS